MKHSLYATIFGGVLVAATMTIAAPAISAPLYSLTKTVSLGEGTKWDYLRYDKSTNRVYISQGKQLTVMDADTGAIVGHVTGLPGAHGVAINAKAGFGYADSAKNKNIIVFNLKTLAPVKTVDALDDADGMAYDAVSNQVFTTGGDAKAVMPLDAATNTPKPLIALDGGPEYLVPDGHGSLFVNINDKAELAKVDTKTDTVTATWPITGCVAPKGISMDPKTHRVFSSCQNSVMSVVDADSGKTITTVPIGKGSDALLFDPVRNLVFSSNKEGTLTVIKEVTPDTYQVLDTVTTAPGARTLAENPKTGRIFLVTADVKTTEAPKADGEPVYTFNPDTTKVLIFDPTSK